jgi:uncharacterized membrane protein YfcA
MLVLTALRLAFAREGEALTTMPPGALGIALQVGIGFVVGWLSGLLGVGGGTILVPILVLVFGVPQHLAQGVSLVMVVPTAIAGSLSHLKLGNVERRVVLPAALASVIAGAAFAAVAQAVSGPALRAAFALVLFVTGARMLFAHAQHAPRAPRDPRDPRAPRDAAAGSETA